MTWAVSRAILRSLLSREQPFVGAHMTRWSVRDFPGRCSRESGPSLRLGHGRPRHQQPRRCSRESSPSLRRPRALAGMGPRPQSLLSREQPFVEARSKRPSFTPMFGGAARESSPSLRLHHMTPTPASGRWSLLSPEQPFVEACTVVDCPRRSDWSLISPAQPFVEAQKVRGSDPFRRAQSLLS